MPAPAPAPTPASAPSALLSFVVGASLPAVVVSLGYLTRAFLRTPYKAKIPFAAFPFVVPTLLGVANVVNTAAIPTLGYPLAPLVVGAATGLLFSIIGRFGYDLPRLLFQMPTGTHHRVHIAAPILYALIFTAIITPLTAYLA